MRREEKLFYGWINIILCFMIIFIGTGIGMLTFSIYTVPFTEHYRISRTLYSLSRSISSACGAAVYFFYGPIVKKVGLKNSVVAGLIAYGAAFLLYGSGFGVWSLFLGAVITGLFGGFIGNSALAPIVNNWFNEKRGLLIGIISAASGIGGSIFSPVLGVVLERFGWQASCLLTAVLLLICAVPVWILMKVTPQEKGLRPLGVPQESGAETTEGLTMSEILRGWRFYLTLAGFLLVHMSNSPAYYNVTPHMIDTGYSTMTVTGVMMVVLLICNAGAKPLMGIVNDRCGVLWVMIATCALSAAGALMMAFLVPGQNWYGVLCVILIGSGTPISTIAIPLFLNRVFGSREYGTVMGLTLAVGYIGTTVGTPLANYLFDRSGSYDSSYVLEALFMGIALLFFLAVLAGRRTRCSGTKGKRTPV